MNKGEKEFDIVSYICGYLPMGQELENIYHKYPLFARFVKYGGWIAFQFWLLRAPLTWWMVGILPPKINLIIHVIPSYLLADFIAGTLLAIGGFFLSEYWIWSKQDE